MGRHDSCSSFGHLESASPSRMHPSTNDGGTAKTPLAPVVSSVEDELRKKRKDRDIGMTPMSTDTVAVQTKRCQNKSLAGMQWFEYDADIVDNLSKTKRFATECMSDDVASLMSLNSSHQDGDSPSPLSKYRKKQRHDDRTVVPEVRVSCTQQNHTEYDACVTPVKSRLHATITSGAAGVGPISPSDTTPEDHVDLRRTALVRLALRHKGEPS